MVCHHGPKFLKCVIAIQTLFGSLIYVLMGLTCITHPLGVDSVSLCRFPFLLVFLARPHAFLARLRTLALDTSFWILIMEATHSSHCTLIHRIHLNPFLYPDWSAAVLHTKSRSKRDRCRPTEPSRRTSLVFFLNWPTRPILTLASLAETRPW
jgi:hypothetical protein